MKTSVRAIVWVLLCLGMRLGWAETPPIPTPSWTPATTYAVIVGVLHWQDKQMTTYPTANRQDEELYRTFLARGVPADHMKLLLDEQATLANIRSAITAVASRAPQGSTFVFYYAGHGFKRGVGDTYFANYDLRGDRTTQTGLNLKEISQILTAHFKGQYVWLMADCCYSGSLKQVVEAVSRNGASAMSLTSADDIDTSTGNWTFTETVIGGLRGESSTLSDLSTAVGAAMQCRENQRFGFYNKGWSLDTMMGSARVKKTSCKNPCEGVTFTQYPVGSMVMVDWQGTPYLAKVLKHDGVFHYITYPGWPASNDEWVTSSRIKGVADAQVAEDNVGSVLVEWQGRWYPAQILKQEGHSYYIHYAGYEASWDEWVGPRRIRRVK